MELVKRILCAFFLISVPLAAARGAELPEPKVDYSADSLTETDQATLKATIYYTPGKERHEQGVGGLKQILIIRKDKNLVWLLMPEQKMYMELTPSAQTHGIEIDLSHYQIERTRIGEEIVEGIKTTKSKMVMRGPDGAHFDGFLWTTPEEIAIKMEAATQGGGEKHRVKTTLKNLKVGKQDPALFEVPAGYQKISMENLFGGMGNAPGGKEFNIDELMKKGVPSLK